MEAQLVVVVLPGRGELVGPRDPAALNDPHHLCAGCPEGRQHVMDVLTPLLRITGGPDCIADFGGARLDRPHDTQQHAAGEATPRAILPPRLAFEACCAFDLTRAQRAEREARARGGAPPARPGQRTAPQARFIGIEHHDRATARLVLEPGPFQSPIRDVSRVGLQAPGRAIGAYRLFFHTSRTLSRPSGTPVARAKTVASSRPLHWEWREPGWRGSAATRRLRGMASSQVTVGGRPERGRSMRPCVPWCAKRWTHLRRAAYVNWRVSATVWRRCPLTTSRTACARRKPPASFGCFTKVSQVARASSGKWSWRVRMKGVSTIKDDKNMTMHHSTSCSYP